MNKYNYLENMSENIIAFVRKTRDYLKKANGFPLTNWENLQWELHDYILEMDKVTGVITNAQTVRTEDLETCLRHNWTLLLDAAEEFDENIDSVCKKGPRYADSLIRRYLLAEAVQHALDTLEANGEVVYKNAE